MFIDSLWTQFFGIQETYEGMQKIFSSTLFTLISASLNNNIVYLE